MIKAVSAPKVRYEKWLVLPYTYAAAFTILAVATLMGVGGFDFAGISYETPGTPELAITVAAMQIFALPFLLRLPLSPLARFISATLSLVAPFFLLATLGYLAAQGVVAFNAIALLGAGLLAVLGVASFAVLNGQAALKLKK
jgi:hypothetical protein